MICQLGKISQVVVVVVAAAVVFEVVVATVVVFALAVAVYVDAVAIGVVVDIVKATRYLHNYFVFLSLTTGRKILVNKNILKYTFCS